MRTWPAAKYLTYSFWRSWILVVYTAPIWGYLAEGQAASCSFTMYAWSTVAFAVVAALLALFHERTSDLLSRKRVMCAAGIASSLGMLMEYVGAFAFSGGGNALFVAGALLTGIGTAFITVRAGQIYVSARPVVAVTNTALSEVASGLVFFFVAGTVPAIALLVAAFLPLAASLMTLFDFDDAESLRKRPCRQRVDLDPSIRKASASAFIRFLVVVFLLTFMANLSKGAFALQDADASLASGAMGVSLVILVSFALVLVSSLLKSFDFGVAYYPLVLVLVLAVVVVFSSDVGNGAAASAIMLVYCLFSLFMWCLLTYLARSDYWSPVQVFGWGRSVFALGSLVGLVVGQCYPSFGLEGSQSFVIGLVLAFLLVAASMLIFRESDVRTITNASWLSEEMLASPNYRVEQCGLSNPSPEEGAPADADKEPRPSRASEGSGLRRLSSEEFAADHNLTSREREVFDLMLRGRDAKSIGEALVISDNTAKAHIRSIYAKTGVHTRQEFSIATEHLDR
ncbi:transcriptional regulator MalT [Coriobacteriaceae bacterium CHKCI002]|nr:transcriptional regulator MalT [Coriobacteriaceae bacterium CHKCI002]